MVSYMEVCIPRDTCVDRCEYVNAHLQRRLWGEMAETLGSAVLET
jgi:hypothetical protein